MSNMALLRTFQPLVTPLVCHTPLQQNHPVIVQRLLHHTKNEFSII